MTPVYSRVGRKLINSMRYESIIQDHKATDHFELSPMGIKEENSVLDRFNRLWRCPNVLVVDGACWPSSGGQSPTLTMMAITRRACLRAVRTQND